MPVTSTEVVWSFAARRARCSANSYRALESPAPAPESRRRHRLRYARQSSRERMAGEDVELMVTRQPGDAMTPYERLLGDAMRGDLGLFGRQDAIEAQWAVVDPVLGTARLSMTIPAAPGVRGKPRAGRGRRRLDRSASLTERATPLSAVGRV